MHKAIILAQWKGQGPCGKIALDFVTEDYVSKYLYKGANEDCIGMS